MLMTGVGTMMQDDDDVYLCRLGAINVEKCLNCQMVLGSNPFIRMIFMNEIRMTQLSLNLNTQIFF